MHFLDTPQYSAVGSAHTPLQRVDKTRGFKAQSGEDGWDRLIYKTAFITADGPT
jgi:hypothetical protein